MFVHFQRCGRSRMVLHTVFRWWQRDRAGLSVVYSYLGKTTTLGSQNEGEKNKTWLAEAAWLKEGKKKNHPKPNCSHQILKLSPVSDWEDAN